MIFQTNPPPLKSEAVEQDYVDRHGKTWTFRANVGKNISQDEIFTKFGFTGIHRIGKATLNLYCQKANPDGVRCPFVGIYLMSNGCLYIRGEHEQ